MMHRYRAYDLNIYATLPLPELVVLEEASVASSEQADIIIRHGKVADIQALGNGASAQQCIRATPEGIYLAWEGVGAFLVREGREIIVDPAPGVYEYTLRLFLLGTTLAMLLHQRGLAVFHASAVSIADQAVAFMGVKAGGKSSIAATFHARGHDLMADDILAVDPSYAFPMALPGFPHMKLWPDSVASLGHVPETLPRLHPALEKRGQRIITGFAPSPVPLKCIYMLCLGSQPEIEPLRPTEAWGALMPHWYGARFGKDLLQGLGLSTHFRQCANLANDVPVFSLKRPRSLSALRDVARLVEAHLASTTQREPHLER